MTTNQKIGEVSKDKCGACLGQSDKSINASNKVTINKNATLKRSKSWLEKTTEKQESVPHSLSFCGQSSIPESDGDIANPVVQFNIPETVNDESLDNSRKNDNLTPEEDGDVHTSASYSNLQFGNRKKKDLHLENNEQLQSQQQLKQQANQHNQENQKQSKQQYSQKYQQQQQLSQQHSYHKKLPQKQQFQQFSNDQKQIQKQRESQTYQAHMHTVMTSTTTASIPTNSVITSTTTAVISTNNVLTTTANIPTNNVLTSTTTAVIATDNVLTSTAIAGTSVTAVTSQAQPLTLHLKQNSPANSKESSQDLHSPFTPPSLRKCCYSKWLSQRWQGTQIEQFHDDLISVSQLQEEERKNNNSVEISSVDKLSCGAPPEHKTAVLTSSRGTVSNYSTPEQSSSNKSLFTASSSPGASASTSASSSAADLKADLQQHTTLDCSMNDLGAREIPTSMEMSVIQNSSISSPSPDVDYVSIPFPSTSKQFPSRQSSTLSSQTSVSSLESSTSSLSLSEATQTSIPTAVISPTCAGTFLKKEKRKDFIVLNTDADEEEAERYRDHLKNDIGIPDITADLFGEIDSGQSAMTSLETLHDRYNYILVLGTINSADDKFSRFLSENILTTGLKDANGKEDRVIPVWASGDCKHLISELKIIKGFEYYFFLSDSTSYRSRSYINCVKATVKKGRKNSDKF